MTRFQTWLWSWRIERAIPEVQRIAREHPDEIAYHIHDQQSALSVFLEYSSQTPRLDRTSAEEGEQICLLFLARWHAQELARQAAKDKRTASLLRRWRPSNTREAQKHAEKVLQHLKTVNTVS